jgi:hypothetical protein
MSEDYSGSGGDFGDFGGVGGDYSSGSPARGGGFSEEHYVDGPAGGIGGWFGRLSASFGNAVFGLVLFVVSFPVLYYNEKGAVEVARSLDQGHKAVVEAPLDRVDPALDDKPVHLTGIARGDDLLADPVFKVEVEGLRLQRIAEIYQYKEEVKEIREKQSNGQTRVKKEYTYSPTWSSEPIDSAKFHEKARNQYVNTGTLDYNSQTWSAPAVKVGPYTLSTNLVNQITGGEMVPPKREMLADLPPDVRRRADIRGEYVYIAAKEGTAKDQIGDQRYSFRVLKPTTVSLVARQQGDKLSAYQAKGMARPIEMLKNGEHSADQMFASAQAANSTWTWVLRFVGFLMMAIGIGMVFSPIVTLVDFIPILNGLVGAGVGLFALCSAIFLSLTTIVVCWVLVRPEMILLLVVAFGALAVLFMVGRKKRPALATAGGPVVSPAPRPTPNQPAAPPVMNVAARPATAPGGPPHPASRPPAPSPAPAASPTPARPAAPPSRPAAPRPSGQAAPQRPPQQPPRRP